MAAASHIPTCVLRVATTVAMAIAHLWIPPSLANAEAIAEVVDSNETLAPLVDAVASAWDGPLAYRVTTQPLSEQLHAEPLMWDSEVEPAQAFNQQRTLPTNNFVSSISRTSSTASPFTIAFSQSRPEYARIAAIINGNDAKFRQSTDVGSLLSKSPAAVGVRAIKRSPIVTGHKTRGAKTNQQLASGSYWLPARMDLDTALSKIDSRLLQEVTVIKGPYSSIYGPGFSFTDFQLKQSPRYNGFQYHGETSIDYESNGQQWSGRQTVLGGDNDSGFRLSYGHRTGNDYESGNGTEIPSSYKSRDITFSYGIDISPGTRIEFSALRLDQTDVEMPGQAFDIDYLVTDAYEIDVISETSTIADLFEFSTWYNRTELAGSSQRTGKRRQFPVYDAIDFVGDTDVDSMSTGYTAGWTWLSALNSLTAGTDLRYVRQELNEITSGNTGLNFWRDRNSPIPRSHQANPGLFVQSTRQITSDIKLTSGARLDLVSANIDDDPANLTDLGVRNPAENPLTLGEIIGGDDLDRDFLLSSTFLLAELQLTSIWNSTLGYGYSERAPSLTELYATESFMFLLQNGLNTVTGDPNLDEEKLWQIDAGLNYDDGRLRGGVSGFHAWIRDYITFENTDTFSLVGTTEQTNLKFVNTDLATLAGGELYAEYDSSPWLTMFGTLSYVEGRDRSRNGDFATTESNFNSTIPSVGSEQVAGLPRGSFGGVAGADHEPLPNIGPMEARLGVRLHEAGPNPNWGLEVAARIVDNQDRVATSLLESATPGFTIWDVRGFIRTRPGLLLVAGIENLTDKQYREYLDFRPQNGGALTVYQPGVNFYFGSELTY